MTVGELAVLLPLAALCLWLTIFVFTLLDHFIYRGTYGHFLLRLESVEREAGASDAGIAAMSLHMQHARTRYLARYLSNAGSRREPARLAAEAYVARIGAETVVARAGEHGARRRSMRIVALYALSRTSHPEALALLEQALASRKPVLAYAALDMLDIYGSECAAKVLLRALESGVLPASRITTHLEHFAVDLTPLYVSWLEGGHGRSRYWVAYLLGKSRYSQRSGQILEALLSDSAADVRKIALSALSALDAPGLEAHAMRMLGDPMFFVRTQAARILARFPDPEVVHALVGRLADEHDAVQLAVKRSLVELGAVTLDHLPPAVVPQDAQADDTIAQITNSIRHAQEAADATRHLAVALEASHAR